MATGTKEVLTREYSFDTAVATTAWSTAETDAGSEPDLYNADGYGAKLMVGDENDLSAIYLGDQLPFHIDRLLSVEFLYRLENWEPNAEAYLGMISAYNADPDVIAASAFVKIAGTTGLEIALETDDGTNDLSTATGILAKNNASQRLVIDFRSGIQSISPPSQSVGGKGSVCFTVTDSQGVQVHPRLTQHHDMSNYAAGLQPYAMTQLIGGGASPDAQLRIQQVIVKIESP